MLFSSVEFLVMFLPVVMLFGLLTGRIGTNTGAVVFLLLAGLFFYGWFRWAYLSLLVLSILVNFLAGTNLIANPRKLVLTVAIAANLVVLGFYKYALFFTSTLGFEIIPSSKSAFSWTVIAVKSKKSIF